MSVYKYKKKNNTYWYVKYKNKTKRGFKTKHDALLYESKLKLSLIDNIETESIYFFNVANDYLDYLKVNTSYGTYSKFKTILNNIIIPNVKNKKISCITELDCRNFRNYVLTLNYSTTYKNYILNKYKAIFKHAKKYYRLTHNPSIIIDPLQYSYKEKINKKNKEYAIWKPDEFEQFINCVNKEMYKELFVILYYTGLRLGEALALKWCDLDGNILHITKSLTRKTTKGFYEIKEPKNISSIRDIDLGKNLFKYLLDFKNKEMLIDGFNDNWFIFGRVKPLPQTSIDRIKDNAIKQANVKRITIHQFRHSHASNLICNNINIVSVSKRLGHSDINMTLSIYTHLIKDIDKDMINFIDITSQNLLKK